MERRGTLTLEEHEFKVTSATLGAALSRDGGALEWFLEVEAASATIRGRRWSPRAYLERFSWPVHSTGEFSSLEVSIPDGAAFCGGKLLPGGRAACLYVFGHEHLRDVKVALRFEAPHAVHVAWTARCSIDSAEDLPLKVSCVADFTGLSTPWTERAQAEGAVRSSFDVTELGFAALTRPERGVFAPVSLLAEVLGRAVWVDDTTDVASLARAVGPGPELERVLSMAMKRERERCLPLLLDAGAKLASTERLGMTPLHGAAQLGSERLVRFFLARGIPVDAQDHAGFTPLMVAATDGHERAVRVLLEAGADRSRSSRRGLTALALAEKKGHAALVELLRVH